MGSMGKEIRKLGEWCWRVNIFFAERQKKWRENNANEIVQENFPEMKEMSFHRHHEKRSIQKSAYNFRMLEIKDLKNFLRENTVPIQWNNNKTHQEQHWKLWWEN